MEPVLNGLLENSTLPVTTAFILGLLTAISPCPLATNITAVGYIGKDLENRDRVFVNGLLYTLGRALTYTLLAFLIYLGADRFSMSGAFQKYGERLTGPLLILTGFFLLNIMKIRFPGVNKLTRRFEEKGIRTRVDVLVLGMLFALAFCPYSGVLYFGILVPLTLTSVAGLYLPVVYALATGIPVIIFAWVIAYTLSGAGRLYNRVKTFEIWFRYTASFVFISIGIYDVVRVWI